MINALRFSSASFSSSFSSLRFNSALSLAASSARF
nr:MAG TPA: hypothetical protein [Caudoviricetes sp.]